MSDTVATRKPDNFGYWLVAGAILLFITGYMLFTAGWDTPPVLNSQNGYRGTAMVQIRDAEAVAALAKVNVVPAVPYEANAEGPRAREIYPNLQLLGGLSEDQFNRLMQGFAEWVAPKDGDNAGCAYCHNVENMADGSKYTHKVALRMIQMTWTINTDWKAHVADTGVTCYTCHRGQPVPAEVWFRDTGGPQAAGGLGWRNGQNVVARYAGSTSLPHDHLSEFLLRDRNIRVHTNTALPSGNKATIMDTEWTYALMIHMSESLGVNCTFCHNSRAFNEWQEGPVQRVTAWHGIRMTRTINQTYLQPLLTTYPRNRRGPADLGPEGDAPKVNCATCHQGVNKPLGGVSMVKAYLSELGPRPR